MKRKACMIVALLVAIIITFNIAYIVKDEFFYSLNNLPTGELLREDKSNSFVTLSTGNRFFVYEIKATHEHPSAIRVAVKNDQTGEDRTIYWQIGTLENLISWPEDQESVVIINGVPIDYINGYYDCRDYPNFTYTSQETNTKRNGL